MLKLKTTRIKQMHSSSPSTDSDRPHLGELDVGVLVASLEDAGDEPRHPAAERCNKWNPATCNRILGGSSRAFGAWKQTFCSAQLGGG